MHFAGSFVELSPHTASISGSEIHGHQLHLFFHPKVPSTNLIPQPNQAKWPHVPHFLPPSPAMPYKAVLDAWGTVA